MTPETSERPRGTTLEKEPAPEIPGFPARKRRAMIQVLGAITYGELKAYDGAMKAASEATDETEKRAQRKVAAEELRHHKGFTRRLVAFGADVERAMAPYRGGLDTFHSTEDPDVVHQAVAGYLGEGIAADMLGWFQQVADEETARFITTVIEDEVEHEALATRRLVDLIAREADGRRRAEEGVRSMVLRMLGAGAGRGGSGYRSFGAFLELGRPLDLVSAIVGGMARRVSALGISPLAPWVPTLPLTRRLPDPLGLFRKAA